MGRKLSFGTIQNLLAEGALEAQKTFELWSDGFWIEDYGIESFMTTMVTKHLQENLERAYFLMEARGDDIENALEEKHIGRRPDFLHRRERIDICILDRFYFPFAIVEVKRQYSNGVHNDVRRISERLRRFGSKNGGSLRSGHCVFLVSGNGIDQDIASDKVEKRAARIEQGFEGIADVRRSDIHMIPRGTYDFGEEDLAYACTALAAGIVPPH